MAEKMEDPDRERYVRTIFTLANLLVLSNFLMFRFATDPERLTPIVQVATWAIFAAALIAVNIWLYFSYYRKPKQLPIPN